MTALRSKWGVSTWLPCLVPRGACSIWQRYHRERWGGTVGTRARVRMFMLAQWPFVAHKSGANHCLSNVPFIAGPS